MNPNLVLKSVNKGWSGLNQDPWSGLTKKFNICSFLEKGYQGVIVFSYLDQGYVLAIRIVFVN